MFFKFLLKSFFPLALKSMMCVRKKIANSAYYLNCCSDSNPFLSNLFGLYCQNSFPAYSFVQLHSDLFSWSSTFYVNLVVWYLNSYSSDLSVFFPSLAADNNVSSHQYCINLSLTNVLWISSTPTFESILWKIASLRWSSQIICLNIIDRHASIICR